MSEEEELRSEIDALAQHLIRDNLSKYPNLRVTEDGEYYTEHFSVNELRCRCETCNREEPHRIPPAKLSKMEDFRIIWGSPFTPNSTYRCELHPKEQKKDKPGEHTRGAMDVPVRGGAQRFKAVNIALSLGATGIGVANTFVHFDFRDTIPMVWKY